MVVHVFFSFRCKHAPIHTKYRSTSKLREGKYIIKFTRGTDKSPFRKFVHTRVSFRVCCVHAAKLLLLLLVLVGWWTLRIFPWFHLYTLFYLLLLCSLHCQRDWMIWLSLSGSLRECGKIVWAQWNKRKANEGNAISYAARWLWAARLRTAHTTHTYHSQCAIA